MKKSNKQILAMQELVLLKNSEEPKKEIYGNLYDCLNYYNKLMESDLDDKSKFDKKAKVVLLSHENKKELINETTKEWFSTKYVEEIDEIKHCQLCGQKNKYIHYIQNKVNKSELNVGSDCITKFPDIHGAKQKKREFRESQKIARKIEFEILEGDDLNFLDNIKKEISEFAVVLPYELDQDLKEYISAMDKVKAEYINGKGNCKKLFDDYSSWKPLIKEQLKLASKHLEKMENDPLVCRRKTAQWLNDHNPVILEQIAQNNGLFTQQSLKKIYSKDFIKENIEIFNACLDQQDITMTKVKDTNVEFRIKNSIYKNPITFFVPISDFMKTIGYNCIFDRSYRFSFKDFTKIEIVDNRNNFKNIYTALKAVFNKKGYDIYSDKDTAQIYWKKLYIKPSSTHLDSEIQSSGPFYWELNTKDLLNTISPYLLHKISSIEYNFNKINEKLVAGKSIKTESDLRDERSKFANMEAGLQQQREFI